MYELIEENKQLKEKCKQHEIDINNLKELLVTKNKEIDDLKQEIEDHYSSTFPE